MIGEAKNIGDVVEYQIQIWHNGELQFQDFYDDILGESVDRFFEKYFRFSFDGIRFGEWMELNFTNLSKMNGTTKNGCLIVQFRYVRSGSNQTNNLIFFNSQLIFEAQEISPISSEAFENSFLRDYLEGNEVVQKTFLSLMTKLYESGIVPEFVERGEGIQDDDYVDFWSAIVQYLSLFLAHADKFENIYNDRDMLLKYIKSRGLFVCEDKITLLQLQKLSDNFYDEINKRGTNLIFKKAKSCKEFTQTFCDFEVNVSELSGQSRISIKLDKNADVTYGDFSLYLAPTSDFFTPLIDFYMGSGSGIQDIIDEIKLFVLTYFLGSWDGIFTYQEIEDDDFYEIIFISALDEQTDFSISFYSYFPYQGSTLNFFYINNELIPLPNYDTEGFTVDAINIPYYGIFQIFQNNEWITVPNEQIVDGVWTRTQSQDSITLWRQFYSEIDEEDIVDSSVVPSECTTIEPEEDFGIHGEFLRLICFCLCKEFVYEACRPEMIGWKMGNSSPLYKGLDKSDMVKAYELKSFRDLSKYRITSDIDPEIVEIDGIQDVLKLSIPANGEVFIGGDSQETLDRCESRIQVNPNIDYSIEFRVKRESEDVDIAFGIYAFDKDGNLLQTKEVEFGQFEREFIDINSNLYPGERDIFYHIRGILYRICSPNLPRPYCYLSAIQSQAESQVEPSYVGCIYSVSDINLPEDKVSWMGIEFLKETIELGEGNVLSLNQWVAMVYNESLEIEEPIALFPNNTFNGPTIDRQDLIDWHLNNFNDLGGLLQIEPITNGFKISPTPINGTLSPWYQLGEFRALNWSSLFYELSPDSIDKMQDIIRFASSDGYSVNSGGFVGETILTDEFSLIDIELIFWFIARNVQYKFEVFNTITLSWEDKTDDIESNSWSEESVQQSDSSKFIYNNWRIRTIYGNEELISESLPVSKSCGEVIPEVPFDFGRHLRFSNPKTCYIVPFIQAKNNSETEQTLYLTEYKIRPLRTKKSYGFLNTFGVVRAILQNSNEKYSEEQIEFLTKRFLIPYDTLLMFEWISNDCDWEF
jgi:hypothetical protein